MEGLQSVYIFSSPKAINEDLRIFEIPLRCQRVKATSNDEDTSREIDKSINRESYQFNDERRCQ